MQGDLLCCLCCEFTSSCSASRLTSSPVLRVPLLRPVRLVARSRTALGFHVITVPEAGTPLFENVGGYDPRWAGTPAHVSLQGVVLKMQLAQEDAYRAVAALRPEPCVLLHDRGALDGSSFCSEEEWVRVLAKEGTTESLLLERYELVLHLASTASDEEYETLYQYGEGSNNPARFHNPQQAKLADRKSKQVGLARGWSR
jgi:hypothetical protein